MRMTQESLPTSQKMVSPFLSFRTDAEENENIIKEKEAVKELNSKVIIDLTITEDEEEGDSEDDEETKMKMLQGSMMKEYFSKTHIESGVGNIEKFFSNPQSNDENDKNNDAGFEKNIEVIELAEDSSEDIKSQQTNNDDQEKTDINTQIDITKLRSWLRSKDAQKSNKVIYNFFVTLIA